MLTKAGWYYHRLRAMNASELAHRVSERWKHRSDATFAETLRGIGLGRRVPGVISLPDRSLAPEELKEALARDAEAIIQGHWRLFGWQEADVGVPPRWHEDVIRGVALAPDDLAHRLNHRTLPRGADARTVWEINRWSEVVRLAMQAWLNDDTDAARVALEWLDDWCDKNAVGRGINWTSPLEVGLRLIDFVWIDALLEGMCDRPTEEGAVADTLQPSLDRLAERIVPAHAAWVWRYRSFGSSANNHLLGELVGLLHAVRRWPALEGVTNSAENLWQEISRCVLGQFAGDGGNREQALHYHLFAWEMAWHAARIMRVSHGDAITRLQKAADFFTHVAHDDEQWEYGDNDDAQIVPLTLNRERAVAEWRDWMLGGDKAAAASSIRFWLGGFEAHGGPAMREDGWWLAPESGMAVCERDGWKLRVDASPLGFGAMAAHGHCDALHVSLWDGPLALVIDPGTGGYFGMKDLRASLAAWEAHNSPQPLAGFQTPKRAGTFLWQNAHGKPAAELGSGEIRLKLALEGMTFPRTVTYDGNLNCVVVFDCGMPGLTPPRELPDGIVTAVHEPSSDRVKFRSRWHLAPECRVDRFDPGTGEVRFSRDGGSWMMKIAAPMGTFTMSQAAAMASRGYGRIERCTVIEVIGDDCVRIEWHRI